MSDGAVIHIAPNTEAPVPLHVIFVSDANAAKGVAHLRNLIVAGPQLEGDGDRELRLARRQPLLHQRRDRSEGGRGRDAHALQDPAREPARVPRAHDRRAAGARQPLRLVLLRDRCVRSRARTSTRISMARGAARRSTASTWRTTSSTWITRRTSCTSQPNCFSREIYKGILSGSAHGVFNGKVYVYPIAQKTDGKQTNNNLLLSRARAHRHEAAARDLRGRRALHARRDGGPAR